ncbi:MAG: DUF4292 domain-containing protein [Bacteroidaceae bacterium]|nr:DUF4292 domain-containing protein [Bacteroidaceae bacterium]
MEKRKRKNSLFASFTTLLMMLLMVAFGACSTKKSATGDIGALTVKEIKSLPAMQKTGDNLSAKLKLNANIKGKTFSAGGNLKIKRGEGLQISINALGGLIEVARIEMTPEKMLLIYRLGREYAEVRYSEIETFRSLGLDYSMLEAILMNEVFAPEENILDKALAKMDVKAANGEIILTTPRSRNMQYSFHIEQSSGSLVLTRGDYNSSVSVDCNYADFTDFAGRSFPRQINFSVADMALNLSLSSIKDGSLKLTSESSLSSYSKVAASKLINGLKF